MPRIERSFEVAASPESVFEVISDFERYPEFLPEIREARSDRSSERSALARFDLFILLHVRYSIEAELSSPHKISWKLNESNVLEVNQGSWEIESTDTGSHVRYSVEKNFMRKLAAVEIELKGAVPEAILERLSGNHLDAMIERFRGRILAFQSAGDQTRVASS